MSAILPRALGFLQGGLNTKVCPGFHRVVFVILPGKKKENYVPWFGIQKLENGYIIYKVKQMFVAIVTKSQGFHSGIH